MMDHNRGPDPTFTRPPPHQQSTISDSVDSSHTRATKRRKTAVACDICRARKVRCNGSQPVCDRCQARNEAAQCTYLNGTSESEEGNQKYVKELEAKLEQYEQKIQQMSVVDRDIIEKPPVEYDNMNSDGRDPTIDPGRSYGTPSSFSQYVAPPPAMETSAPDVESAHQPNPGVIEQRQRPSLHATTSWIEQVYTGRSSSASFMNSLRRTVNARSGLKESSSTTSFGITLADLGSRPIFVSVPPHDDSLSLPPRDVADHLMNIYWQNLYPIYPVVDKAEVEKSYSELWQPKRSQTDRNMPHCILNVMFALAAQCDITERGEDEVEKKAPYFSRARKLMRMDVLGGWSIELVQALILCAQFLQSTDEPHRYWTVVGTSIRMAESLGIHLPSTYQKLRVPSERVLARRVWDCCVSLDRVAAISLGRLPFINKPKDKTGAWWEDKSPPEDESLSSSSLPRDSCNQDFQLFSQSTSLFNILYCIVIAFYQADGQKDQRLPSRYFEQATTFEDSLGTWRDALPKKFQNAEEGDPHFHFLYLRYLRVKHLLYRPALSAIMSTGTEHQPLYSLSHGPLRTSGLLSCAKACIEAAMEISTLVSQHIFPRSGITILNPWWYDISYSYTAATTIQAARISPDLTAAFGMSTLDESMRQCTETFKHYEAISASARRCQRALAHISSVPQNRSATQTSLGSTGSASISNSNDQAQLQDTVSMQGLVTLEAQHSFLEDPYDPAFWLNSVPSDFHVDQWLASPFTDEGAWCLDNMT